MGHPADKIVHRCLAAGTIALDSMVFIYLFQDTEPYAEICQQVLQQIEGGRCQGIISTLVLSEVLVHPLQRGFEAEAMHYFALLTTFPNLRLMPPDEEICWMAARLRAEQGLRTPDAIHVATAAKGGAKLLITNDHKLAQVSVGQLEILVIDEYLKPN